VNGRPFVLRAEFSVAAHDAGVPSATSSSPPEMSARFASNSASVHAVSGNVALGTCDTVVSWRYAMPTITGAHHLALTVTDVERSAAWYRDLLGLVRVLDGSDDTVTYQVLAHPDSGWVMGVRQYSAGRSDTFDEYRTGLDHLAFGVSSREELDGWQEELDRRGISFTPAVETPIGTVVVFRDPDNIQLEFWLPLGM
jgi:glyoxylase I family protein